MSDPRPVMKQGPRDAWVTRLTDGSYTQLRGSLVADWIGNPPDAGADPGHARQACCLGVLTGCAIEAGVEGVRWFVDEREDRVRVQVWDEEEASMHPMNEEGGWVNFDDEDLPAVVSDWAFADKVDQEGSHHYNPRLREDGRRAIELNDGDPGLTFTEIADLVRALPVKEGTDG